MKLVKGGKKTAADAAAPVRRPSGNGVAVTSANLNWYFIDPLHPKSHPQVLSVRFGEDSAMPPICSAKSMASDRSNCDATSLARGTGFCSRPVNDSASAVRAVERTVIARRRLRLRMRWQSHFFDNRLGYADPRSRVHSSTTYSGTLSNLCGFNCIRYSFSMW